MDTLIGKKSIKILSSIKDEYFDQLDVFDYSNGLNVAVGFTGFDNEVTWSLDPSFGTLEINSLQWGNSQTGQPYSNRVPLPTHRCTREELNLDGDGSKARFFPIHNSSK